MCQLQLTNSRYSKDVCDFQRNMSTCLSAHVFSRMDADTAVCSGDRCFVDQGLIAVKAEGTNSTD